MSIALAATQEAAPSAVLQTPDAFDITAWEPRLDDRLIIDTKENAGYLVHSDGAFVTFPVLTGQRRFVRYIGRTYDATTPIAQWVMQSQDIKGDRVTFGVRGLFLRLYRADQRTPYGIHGHRYFTQMLNEGNRFRSMGCILVSEEVLSIIERTFMESGNALPVTTAYGVTEHLPPLITLRTNTTAPDWIAPGKPD